MSMDKTCRQAAANDKKQRQAWMACAKRVVTVCAVLLLSRSVSVTRSLFSGFAMSKISSTTSDKSGASSWIKLGCKVRLKKQKTNRKTHMLPKFP